ncbi:MAG: N-6 DNA methylase [Candidatus Bathyarchaeia archaeon]
MVSLSKVAESVRNGLEQVDTQELAKAILRHASASTKEEELKIRVEATLRPILEKLGIQWASYEHGHRISGGRKDALYGHVILEYKSPGKLDSKIEFTKAKEQVKEYIHEQSTDKRDYSKYFGVIIDGYKISFLRFRSGQWEEQDQPLSVNKETVRTLLRAIRGLRLKIIEPATLVADFGPGDLSRKIIELLYDSLREPDSKRTQMLFEDWKRVFSQVCSYAPEKLSALVEYYGLKQRNIDIEKLMFCIHTYYTLLMKLITSEVISYFNPMFGSFLERIETAYHTKLDDMKKELEELEEGGIIAQLGIRNLLEADYFAWYLDEWSKGIAVAIMLIVEQLKEYDPATSELYPERVKDLFKRLYQNLVPRKVRHDLGEYFTPDWLADLVLDEVGYDGNPEKRVLDPACGSGTFLVLAIGRVKAWAEKEFYPDKKELLRRITSNVIGIDLNPLAILAAKANYILALGELNRLLPGLNVDIPVYLADSILVSRKQSFTGELEVYLRTAVGDFVFPNEIIDSNHLPKALSMIETGMRGEYTKDQFHELMATQLKGLKSSTIDSLTQLFVFMRRLEREGKNRIWTRLLKNSFAPLLMGKFDFVVGNPPWINWENLPEKYRDDTKTLWNSYGLLERTEGASLGKVKRDMAMLFTVRCLDRYVTEKGRFAFLIPFTTYKSQSGAGFRRFLANGLHNEVKRIDCNVTKIHDLVTLYPFEGATNRTSMVVIQKDNKSQFPIPCTMWHNRRSTGINQEERLHDVKIGTDQFQMILAPIVKGKPESPWMITTEKALRVMQKVLRPSEYRAYAGVYTALNGVYWIDIVSHQPSQIVVQNLSQIGKKKVTQTKRVVEPDLIYPLIQGRNVKKWYSSPENHKIIVPHNPKNGDPLDERTMKVRFSKTYELLLSFKKDLEGRAIHKLWGKGKPFYSLYDIGEYTFTPYRVAWKEIAGKISGKGLFSVAVIGPWHDRILKEKVVVPDHKLMFVPCANEDEAHFVASVLNSSIAQLAVTSYTIETMMDTHITNHVYVPRYDAKNEAHARLSGLSQRAHEIARRYYERQDSAAQDELRRVEDEIDKTCATLYEISNDELDEIRKTLRILTEGETEEPADETGILEDEE